MKRFQMHCGNKRPSGGSRCYRPWQTKHRQLIDYLDSSGVEMVVLLRNVVCCAQSIARRSYHSCPVRSLCETALYQLCRILLIALNLSVTRENQALASRADMLFSGGQESDRGDRHRMAAEDTPQETGLHVMIVRQLIWGTRMTRESVLSCSGIVARGRRGC